jgi:hypothetical protein
MHSPERHRRASIATVTFLALCSLGLGPAHAAEDTDLTEELKLPSAWIRSFEPRLWAGYKDNVLLGDQHTVGSPFLAGGLDVTFYKLPVDGWEYLFLASGEYIRYFTVTNVDQEATALAQAQAKKAFGDGWKGGLSAEYIYINQVLDSSSFAEVLVPVPIQAHGITIRPSLAKTLGQNYSVELELPATRQLFREFIDDYWEVGPKLMFVREFGQKADLSFYYQFADRMHDTREARDTAGILRPGRTLEFHLHDVVAAWRQSWDAKRRWRTLTRLSLQSNNDNGGGYYDYLRPQLSEQVRYRAPTWEVRAEGRLAYYAYERQRLGEAGSPVRHKTYIRLNLRGEKSLTKSCKLFAEYEYERAISNLDIDRYNVNTVFGGVGWAF